MVINFHEEEREAKLENINIHNFPELGVALFKSLPTFNIVECIGTASDIKKFFITVFHA